MKNLSLEERYNDTIYPENVTYNSSQTSLAEGPPRFRPFQTLAVFYGFPYLLFELCCINFPIFPLYYFTNDHFVCRDRIASSAPDT